MGRKTSTATHTPPGKKRDFSFLPSPDSVVGQHYYYVTLRFWPSLVFILPMLIAFELGTYLRSGNLADAPTELVATYLVERMVNVFGAKGFYFLPGLLAIAILLACHLVAKHPWKFDVWVLPGMLGESLIWTLPLFVFSRVLHPDRVIHTALLATGAVGQSEWVDQVIRSFGAGIYEELVFRFICMNVLHMLLVDLCKLPRSPSELLVIIGSALVFAAQHHPPLGAEPFNAVEFMFRAAAGLYLAGLFFYRGFGIAAGCHCFYNVIVVTLEAVRA